MYFEIDDYNALRAALQKMCARFSDEKVPQEIVFDSKLVADELLSNVLQHDGGRAYFRAEIAGDEITLSVRSAKAFHPPEESVLAGVEAECGRGLYLVDSLVETRRYSEEYGTSVVIRITR